MIENIFVGREYYRETGILLEDGIKYLDITGNIYEDKIKNVLIVNIIKQMYRLRFSIWQFVAVLWAADAWYMSKNVSH